MRLVVTTPTAIVLEREDVRHVRGEDATGAFGILPGHADFITVLAVSVVTWRDADGAEHHLAVRGGVLTVRGGDTVAIATREAVGEDTLQRLGESVLARFTEETETEARSRTAESRLHVAALRQIRRYLDAGRRTVAVGLPGAPGGGTAPSDDGGP